jgi:hypothetical protein
MKREKERETEISAQETKEDTLQRYNTESVFREHKSDFRCSAGRWDRRKGIRIEEKEERSKGEKVERWKGENGEWDEGQVSNILQGSERGRLAERSS